FVTSTHQFFLRTHATTGVSALTLLSKAYLLIYRTTPFCIFAKSIFIRLKVACLSYSCTSFQSLKYIDRKVVPSGTRSAPRITQFSTDILTSDISQYRYFAMMYRYDIGIRHLL